MFNVRMLFTNLGHRIFVRYARRKPIWMPTAPSKLFRIPEHNFYDAEEILQIKKLHRTYKVQMESITKLMEEKFYKPATKSGGIPLEFTAKEDQENQEIYAENDRLNAEIAKLKEQYFEKKILELEEKILERKISKEDELIEAAQKIDDYVTRYKSDTESFITPNNIDKMIEKAFAGPISYEFYIDRSGRRYHTTQKIKIES